MEHGIVIKECVGLRNDDCTDLFLKVVHAICGICLQSGWSEQSIFSLCGSPDSSRSEFIVLFLAFS